MRLFQLFHRPKIRLVNNLRLLSASPNETSGNMNSNPSSFNFAEALAKFRNEREIRLQQTSQMMESIKKKERTGVSAQRIETLLTSIKRKEHRTNIVDQGQNHFSNHKPLIIDEYNLQILRNQQQLHFKRRTNSKSESMLADSISFVKYVERTNQYLLCVRVAIDDSLLEEQKAIFVPLLIGSKRFRFELFEAQTGCKINLKNADAKWENNEQGVLNAKIFLMGSEQQLQIAYEKLMIWMKNIKDFLRDSNPKLHVQMSQNSNPTETVQAVIESMKVSGAYVRFNADNNVAKVWGFEEQARKAQAYLDWKTDGKYITSAVRNKVQDSGVPVEPFLVRVEYDISSKSIPVVIGESQSTLRRLKTTTGCDIRFSSSTEASTRITLTGSTGQVASAIRNIEDAIKQYDKFVANVEWRIQIALKDSKEMALVLGKNFTKLRQIQKVTGTYIRASAPGDPSLTLRIWGSPSCAEHAVKSIYLITKHGSPSVA